MSSATSTSLNVFQTPLQVCSTSPLTGFYRNGYCETGPNDTGRHIVCSELTREFLSFTQSRGNDLETPRPEYRFPGLKPGDRWCLCALRWREAMEAGVAPPVVMEATHEKMVKDVKGPRAVGVEFGVLEQYEVGRASPFGLQGSRDIQKRRNDGDL